MTEKAECLSAEASTEESVAYWESLFDEVFGPVFVTTPVNPQESEE